MTTLLILPEKLDTGAAAGFREVLMNSLSAPLTLDGTRVTSLGALGLQLLLAASARAGTADPNVFELRASAELAQDIETMGATAAFGAVLVPVSGESA